MLLCSRQPRIHSACPRGVNFVQALSDFVCTMLRDELGNCRRKEPASRHAEASGQTVRRTEKRIREGNRSFHTLYIP